MFIAAVLAAALAGLAASPLAAAQEADAATKLLMAANGLLAQGLDKMAAVEYESFLAKYPQHAQAPAARYGLAICRSRASQFDQAAALLEQVVRDGKFAQRAEALALLGHCQLQAGRHAEALAALDELLARHGDSPHAEVAALNRAQVLHRMDRHAESAAACQAFLAKYPSSPRRASAEYSLALAQFAQGKYAETAEALARIAGKADSPVAVEGTLLLGRCYEQQGKLAEAARQYQSAVQIAPADRRAEGRYSLGAVLYKAGDYKQAVKVLADALAAEPEGRYAPAVRFQLGLSQLAAGRMDEARKTLAAVARDDKDRRQAARYWLAQCDIAEGKFAEARKAFDGLAGEKPANLEDVLYDRAICTMALGQHEAAAGELEEFRKAFPASARQADAAYRLAFCLHKLSKYAESLPLCQQVAAQDKLAIAPAAADLVAENLFLLARYPEAEKTYRGLAAGDDAGKRRVALRLSQCAYFRGDYAAAIALATPLAEDRSILRDAALRQVVLVLGDAQLQAGQHRQAAQTLARYLPVAGEDRSEVQFKLALAQLRGGDEGLAATTFDALLRKDDSSEWAQRAMFEQAQLCYRRKEPRKAEPVLAKLLGGKVPDELAARAAYLQAWIDYDAGRHAEAAQRFGELARRYPKHELAEQAFYQQGVGLAEAGKDAEALEVFRKFLKDHPQSPRASGAIHHMSRCLVKLGRHEEAVRALAALAADRKTATADVLYQLAWAQRESKSDAAAATYVRLLEEFPESALAGSARAELAELLYGRQKYAEAAALLEKVLADRAADAKTLAAARYRLGWCHEKLDQPEKAAAVFSDFAAKDADSEFAPSALYQAGVAYARLDKLQEAQKQFAALIARFPSHDLAGVTMLKSGEVLAQGQDYDKAEAVYRQYLDKHGQDKFVYLAQFGIGWSLENRRKYDEARQWYEQVIAKHNGPTAARAQFQVGECHFAEGRFEKAAAELLKVDIVYAYPEWSSRALLEAGRAFEALKQPGQARRQYSVCSQKYKDQPAGQQAAKRLKEMDEGK